MLVDCTIRAVFIPLLKYLFLFFTLCLFATFSSDYLWSVRKKNWEGPFNLLAHTSHYLPNSLFPLSDVIYLRNQPYKMKKTFQGNKWLEWIRVRKMFDENRFWLVHLQDSRLLGISRSWSRTHAIADWIIILHFLNSSSPALLCCYLFSIYCHFRISPNRFFKVCHTTFHF